MSGYVAKLFIILLCLLFVWIYLNTTWLQEESSFGEKALTEDGRKYTAFCFILSFPFIFILVFSSFPVEIHMKFLWEVSGAHPCLGETSTGRQRKLWRMLEGRAEAGTTREEKGPSFFWNRSPDHGLILLEKHLVHLGIRGRACLCQKLNLNGHGWSLYTKLIEGQSFC